mgnify:CR=1 FL=1
MTSPDYPMDWLAQSAIRGPKLTQFWQTIGEEMSKTQSLSVTSDMEIADYRVHVRCAGMLRCDMLRVDIATPSRDHLVTYRVRGTGGINKVVPRLVWTLDERIALINQGGIGDFGTYPKEKEHFHTINLSGEEVKDAQDDGEIPIKY